MQNPSQMLVSRFPIFSIIALALVGACKSPQAARPEEYYDKNSLEVAPSVVNIPIRLHKSELQDNLNKRLGEVFYDDKNLSDDGLMVKATRKENITLDLDNQQIKYRVPLKLWVKKDVTITDIEAEGALALEFSTRYSIKPDWSLETQTELSRHSWIQEPVIKLGFGNLPVTSIANAVLNHVRQDLAKTIDKEVKAAFDLKKEVETTWKQLHEPFSMSDEYAARLLLNPQSIGMTPLRASGNVIESTISVVSKPIVSLGQKPSASSLNKLPAFTFATTEGNDFTIYLSADLPFSEVQKMSKQGMVGQVFQSGNKQVKVEDVEVFGQGNKLVISTKLSGSYTGNVFFIAQPEYSPEKNQIVLKNVEFDFDSQKALMKTASWLFKGTLKKKVQENLDFYLKYNLDETRTLMQQALQDYQLAPGINLNGTLDDLNISNLFIAAEGIKVRVGMKGKLNLDVKSLGQ